MRVVVKKFGGTSVGNIARILEVAKKVAAARHQGEQVVVVVSAMAGETDRLVQLSYQVSENPNEREFDLLLSTGEMVSSALLAIALNAMGYAAESFTGRQVGILTDSVHTKARIRKIDGERILHTLEQGKIAVVAGFQGIDEREDMTTLGRGGSDTTAVALAAVAAQEMLRTAPASTRPIPTWYRPPDACAKSPMTRCWRWPALEPRSYRHARSRWRKSTTYRCW